MKKFPREKILLTLLVEYKMGWNEEKTRIEEACSETALRKEIWKISGYTVVYVTFIWKYNYVLYVKSNRREKGNKWY